VSLLFIPFSAPLAARWLFVTRRGSLVHLPPRDGLTLRIAAAITVISSPLFLFHLYLKLRLRTDFQDFFRSSLVWCIRLCYQLSSASLAWLSFPFRGIHTVSVSCRPFFRLFPHPPMSFFSCLSPENAFEHHRHALRAGSFFLTALSFLLVLGSGESVIGFSSFTFLLFCFRPFLMFSQVIIPRFLLRQRGHLCFSFGSALPPEP